MNIIRTDGLGGKGLVFTPASGSYNNVILWFHGLGDTADGWADTIGQLDIEDTKFIFPTAPKRPISINMGMPMPGWADIIDLSPAAPEDREGFSESAHRVHNLINAEMEKGIASNRIVVGGFSQGGALALHVGLRFPHTLAGCVALSTWVPLREDYPAALASANRELPILQAHGTHDQVVAFPWGKSSHELLKTLLPPAALTFKTYNGMGHSSCSQELRDVQEFLKAKLTS